MNRIVAHYQNGDTETAIGLVVMLLGLAITFVGIGWGMGLFGRRWQDDDRTNLRSAILWGIAAWVIMMIGGLIINDSSKK